MKFLILLVDLGWGGKWFLTYHIRTALNGGSLFAIMLGHLQMDVPACIDAYVDILNSIYEKKSVFKLGRKAPTQERFDAQILKKAILKILKKRNVSETDSFGMSSSACRV